MVRPLGRYSRWISTFSRLNSQKKSLFACFFFTTGTEPTRPQPSPPPIRVSFTESAGRGVFATRRIGAGDLIHTAKPLVSHPSLSAVHGVCYFCLKKLPNTSSDSQPQCVQFCSQECREQSTVFYEVERKADWSIYDNYCRIRGLKYPLLVKRLACMVISGVASADCLDILQPASLSPGMKAEMEEEFGLLRSAFTRANVTDKQMACILSSVEAEAAVGNAVYILPSFYNHDCDPNAHIVWIENVDARLKALRDIESGEELRICYIDASMDHDARQGLLSEGFGFQCCCFRCLAGD
ncbi:histone-lysine N-methyltransferase ATXR4 isoform X2 [Malania oleifera]|uniref:histone-lysine N-methyltransferase ATXR4 isoform X2 n=1 Tax=Malania oleifera TaxID=397392 RepID=UPI0025ADB09E|nr:histone-lysine N-methyltransferase ATXR4 isoform X2 [Malania oleifera]